MKKLLNKILNSEHQMIMFKQIVIFLLLLIEISVSLGCNHRDYGNGATVCVCSEKLGCDSLVLNISKVKGKITSYRSTKAGDRFVRQVTEFVNHSPSGGATASVVLNRNKKFQKIIGFGGAFTDATGINIASLPSRLQDRLIRDYYAEDGLAYRLAKIPIGGTDFSTRPYTYDDDHPGDFELRHFELQPEDFKYKIPFLKRAQKVSSSQLKFVATSWSPPAWMKTNNDIAPGYLKGGPRGKYYKLYAKYLIRFLREYNRNNITLWGLTMANEPVFPGLVNTTMNSLLFTAQQQREFLKYDLGPLLARSEFKNIEVMVFDDNYCIIVDQTTFECLDHDFMLDYVKEVLADIVAAKLSSGIAFHGYSNTYGNYDNIGRVLDQLAEKFPDKFFLANEVCIVLQNPVTSPGNWTNFNTYAQDVMNDLNHHASGWIDWNMALDTGGGPNHINNFVDAPVLVNATSGEYYKQPMFYALGHISKFLVPNSVRIQSQLLTNGQLNKDDFLVTAFERPDKSTAMIVLNKNSFPVKFVLKDQARGFAPVEIKPNSMQSFVWY